MVLLIPVTGQWPTLGTAFSVSAEDSLPDYKANTTSIVVYGKVTFHKSDDLSFDQGGRVLNSKASVRISPLRAAQGLAARAIIFKDGSIYRISSGNFSEGRDFFDMECSEVSPATATSYNEYPVVGGLPTTPDGIALSPPPSSGGGAGGITFQQSSASTVWGPIYHANAGFVDVTCVDANGVDMDGEVTYIDNNNLTVTFSAPVSGSAYLV